jgi:hypothetical protein
LAALIVQIEETTLATPGGIAPDIKGHGPLSTSVDAAIDQGVDASPIPKALPHAAPDASGAHTFAVRAPGGVPLGGRPHVGPTGQPQGGSQS